MATYTDKHDIGVTNASSKIIGMMLAQDKNNVPSYGVFDDEWLAAQFFTGRPSTTNVRPQIEIIIDQYDWRSGFGLEKFDYSDSKRYYSSTGMDLSNKGMAIPGPVSTAVTIPTVLTPTLVNGDMELAANWTGGARSSVQKHAGTYSWYVEGSDTNGVTVQATQTISVTIGDYQSRYVALRGWVYLDLSTASTRVRIGINDGQSGIYSDWTTTEDSWVYLTAVGAMAANATQLVVKLQTNSLATEAADRKCYFDDVQIGQGGTIAAEATFNDKQYISLGNVLGKLDADGDEFTEVYAFPATITALEPFTDSALYIAIGTSDPYWAMSTGESFTRNTLSNNYMKFMKTVHTTASTMYATDGDNTIRATVNPAAGGTAWSGQTIVGASYHTFTDFLERSGALYMPKEDMTYYLDSSGNVQRDLAPEVESLTSSTSGKNSLIWLDKLYTPVGDQALLEIGAVNTWRNPSDYSTNLSAFVGRIQALASDQRWLFAIVDNSTKLEILKGRQETVDGTTSWVWHPFHQLTLTGCEIAFTSTVYQKRLWISSTDSSENLYYIPLPVGYGDVTNETNRSFLTATYFETSWHHGNFRSDSKGFYKITLYLGHSYDADIYYEAHYKKRGDSSYTEINSTDKFKGTSSVRSTTAYIPVDSGSVNPVSTEMIFKFVAKTDDVTKAPILEGYDCRALLYPTTRTIIACRVRNASQLTDRDGADAGAYKDVKAALDNLRTATWPITIKDLDGTTQTVKYLELPRGVEYQVPIKTESNRVIEYHYNLMLLVTPLS